MIPSKSKSIEIKDDLAQVSQVSLSSSSSMSSILHLNPISTLMSPIKSPDLKPVPYKPIHYSSGEDNLSTFVTFSY